MYLLNHETGPKIYLIFFFYQRFIYRAYQKKKAIRDYLAIFLRSGITMSIKKKWRLITRKHVLRLSRQDREDRGRIARIAAGCSEMK